MDRRSFLTCAGLAASAAALAPALASCDAVKAQTTSPTDTAEGAYTVVSGGEVSFGMEADVLVIGSGIAGLSAALAPSRAGLSVIVAERETLLGGESYSSCAVMRACQTAPQVEAGVSQSIEDAVSERKAEMGTSPFTQMDRAQMLMELVPDWVDELIEDCGAAFAGMDSLAEEGAPQDFLLPSGGLCSMKSIMEPLRDALVARGVTTLTNHEAISLIVDAEGGVAGARLRTDNDSVLLDVKARAVVLATGGYAGSRQLLHQNAPSQEMLGTSAYLSTGSAIQLTRELDAALVDMDVPLGVTSDSAPMAFLGYLAPVINVDSTGRRFAREDSHAATAQACLEQYLGSWWSIFDKSASTGSATSSIAEVVAAAGDRFVGPCKTVHDLAEATGMSPAILKETFAAYKHMVDEGEDADFGKTFQLEVLEPPYFAFRQIPVMFTTFGGLKVDEAGAVLNASDAPIAGLYACGAAAAGSIDGLATCGSSGHLVGLSLTEVLSGSEEDADGEKK